MAKAASPKSKAKSSGSANTGAVAKKAAATAKPAFPTSPTSPFADKYDIERERVSLADLLEADNPDDSDPRWGRFVELSDREVALRNMKTADRLRHHAEAIVPDKQATAMQNIGELVGEDTDTMSLHTRDAYRLFIGKSRGVGQQGFGEVSGKKVAAALRFVWLMSGNDNPYADLALVQTTERIDKLRQEINRLIQVNSKSLEALKARGLNYSILQSRAPVDVELGFRSPYGYMIAELIVDFDYCARVLKTLVIKDRLSDREGRDRMHDLSRQIRSLFEALIPYQRNLQREELALLSRGDWASHGDMARKRVQASVALFGECPRDVFTGERGPRHSKRKAAPTAQELAYLQNVDLSTGLDEDGSAATEERLV